MKKNLFIAFLFIVKTGFAQKDTVGLNLPMKDGAVVYEAIVETPGKSKDQLNSSARLWLATRLKFSDAMLKKHELHINESASNADMILAKGALEVPFKGALGVTVIYEDEINIQIDLKDSKYRVRIYNQLLSSPAGDYGRVITQPEDLVAKLTGKGKSPFNDKQARRMLESMNAVISNFINNLEVAMAVKEKDF